MFFKYFIRFIKKKQFLFFSLYCSLYLVLGSSLGLKQLFGNSEIWNFAYLIPLTISVFGLFFLASIPETPEHLFYIGSIKSGEKILQIL